MAGASAGKSETEGLETERIRKLIPETWRGIPEGAIMMMFVVERG